MPYNEKQLLIIDAAEKLFALKGFEGASVRDIAHEADINVAMISYYFGSKEKLMEAIFEARTQNIRLKVENLLQDTGKTPLEKVYTLIDDYVEKFMNQQRFHRIMMREQIMENNTPVAAYIFELKKKNQESINRLIHDGQQSGAFRKNIDTLVKNNNLVVCIQTVLV
jgi:AcrR family transcriptional regulator